MVLKLRSRARMLMRGLRYARLLPYLSIDGWLTVDEAIELYDLARSVPEQEPVVVEIGSWQGKSTVVLGKGLSLTPRVLLLDEPTRGIDVGAKQEIYALMGQLAEQGVAILFVSSEMEEILGMSDRTLVMHEGRIAGQLTREQLGEEAVMQLATGNVQAA